MGQKRSDGGQQPGRNPQEDEQVQEVLAHYRQIAQRINTGRSEEQVIDALASINELPEASQIALLKAIGKETTTAAADVALALNTYSSVKEVRKEARRTLLRLESNNVYPEWELPNVLSLSEALGVDAFDGIDEDEDDETLEGETIVEQFLANWTEGHYEVAYDLLATTSPLRQDLSRDEWAARRTTWAAEAKPTRGQVDVGYGLEPELEEMDSDLDESAEDLDAFWSLELEDVASSSDIMELPVATLTYSETGRHWFWASYTFIQEDDELRIYSMRDKGAEALQLPVDELRQRIQEIADEIGAMSEELEEDEDDDADSATVVIESEQIDEDDEDEEKLDVEDLEELAELDMEELTWFTKQAMHYCDALIAQQPQDETGYALATQQATIIRELERAIAYSSLVAERFPELRSEALRAVGLLATELASDEEEMIEEEDEVEEDDIITVNNRFLAIAEKALREAIATDSTNFASYSLLADLLLEEDRQDEARTILEQAQHVAIEPSDKAAIEVGRARLANLQDKPEVALSHFQRAAEIAPDLPQIWYNIGDLQLSLEQTTAAERSLLKSVQLDPATTEAYADLATIYMEQNKEGAALRVLEQGLAENPFSVDLMAEQAMIYIHKGDLRKAEALIVDAEEIDAEAEIVMVIRQVIEAQKEQQRQQRPGGGKKSNKSNKSKKRR